MTTLISWNIARRAEPWGQLAAMDDVDVAILQEAGSPPRSLRERFELGPIEHHDSHIWNSD